jgi:hypothetical protein
MIELLVGYFIGKGAQKNRPCPEQENDMASSTQDWSSSGQDTRSFQELLEQAKEHRANKDNQ